MQDTLTAKLPHVRSRQVGPVMACRRQPVRAENLPDIEVVGGSDPIFDVGVDRGYENEIC